MPFAIMVAIAMFFVARRAYRVSLITMRKADEFMRDLSQRSAKSATEIGQIDNRGPVLFLRNFADDEARVGDIPPLPAFVWGEEHQRRLEEVIADTAWYYGPLVALNDPRAKIAPLGAAKNTVLDENWQTEILNFMVEAAWIVVVVGGGKNLDWEINKIFEGNHEGKTMFVLQAHHVNLAEAFRFEGPTTIIRAPGDETGQIGLIFRNKQDAVVLSSSRVDGRSYAEMVDSIFSERLAVVGNG